MTTAIDHLLVSVPDLADAARRLEDSHGLESSPGGRHPGHGTANQIVALGDSYLELISIVDAEEAEMSTMGRWVAERAGIKGIDALCLRTDDLDSVCARLGLAVTSMSRLRPDGFELRWRLAGLERTIEDGLPFFIEWQVPAHAHPGHVGETGAPSLTRVVISGDSV